MRVYDVGSANWAANLEKPGHLSFRTHYFHFSWTTKIFCSSKWSNNKRGGKNPFISKTHERNPRLQNACRESL